MLASFQEIKFQLGLNKKLFRKVYVKNYLEILAKGLHYIVI